MAVVAASHFDDEVLLGVSAGKADCRHHRLRAAAYKADLLDAVVSGDYFLGQFGLSERRGAERAALLGGFENGFEYRFGGVAEDHGAPGADVVDILVAVDIIDFGAFGRFNEDRPHIYAAERPHGRIH